MRFFTSAILFLATISAISAPALAQSSHPHAYTSYMRYDAQGREVGTIAPDPDGGGALKYLATRTTYDATGLPVKVESGELASWQPSSTAPANWSGFTVHQRVENFYDTMGRLVKVVTRGSDNQIVSVVQSNTDRLGRPGCTVQRMNPARFSSVPSNACTMGVAGADGPDRITRTLHNAAGEVTQILKAVGTPLEQAYATYEYTQNGQQRTVIDANGNRAQLQYDGFDRLSRWDFPHKTQTGIIAGSSDYEAYTYDANGNRLTLRKRDGRTINYEYDTLNRMTRKLIPGTDDNTRDVYYGYDLRGLQTYARFDGHGGGDGIQTSYDGFGRITSSTNTMGGWTKTLSYQYDRNGNRTRITHPDGQFFNTSYDGLNRQRIVKENNSATISDYRYNARGLLTGNYRSSAFYNPHGYDAVGRLSSLGIVKPGGTDNVTFGFSYNPASQIKSRAISNNSYADRAPYNVNRDYAVNGLNQYTAAGPASFAHDANGNLTSGDITGDGAVTYSYDVENRLISARGAKQADLLYDPLGRLWEVKVPGGSTTRFLYDGNAMVAEYEHSAGTSTLTHRYVHGIGADVPTQWYEGSAVSQSNRHHLFPNWQGSIVLITNASGTTEKINRFDEYGIGDETNLGRFQYTGQIHLPELGLYHYKARVYSPTLGRFLQTDPIGYEDQVNLYAYVGNDPVNYVDPTGMCGVEAQDAGCAIWYNEETREASPEAAFSGTMLKHIPEKEGLGETLYFNPETFGLGTEAVHGETVNLAINGALTRKQLQTAAKASLVRGEPVEVAFTTYADPNNAIGNYGIDWKGTISATEDHYEISATGTVQIQTMNWRLDSGGRSRVRDAATKIMNAIGPKGSYFAIPTRTIYGNFQGRISPPNRLR